MACTLRWPLAICGKAENREAVTLCLLYGHCSEGACLRFGLASSAALASCSSCCETHAPVLQWTTLSARPPASASSLLPYPRVQEALCVPFPPYHRGSPTPLQRGALHVLPNACLQEQQTWESPLWCPESEALSPRPPESALGTATRCAVLCGDWLCGP